MIDSIAARSLDIPFRTNFSHASATRDRVQSIWVEARLASGEAGYGEGCPRDYVTGETLAGAFDFVSRFNAQWLQEIRDLDSLTAWVRAHRMDIDANASAWCAVELALLDAFAKQLDKTVEGLLGLPEISGKFRYTAVLGDASAKRFEAELSRYRQAGFRDFKIKLSGDLQRDRDKVSVMRSAGISPGSVRADANNLWTGADAAIRFLADLDFAFLAVEEPIRPGDEAGMSRIAQAAGCAIILDESLLRADQLGAFRACPSRWIVNLRISKMGGLVRSLELLELVRGSGVRVIVGAHVGETSVLTRAALTLANTARDILVAQEGAFGTHLLAHDVSDPSIMFGPGGMLDAKDLPRAPGFGLAILPEPVALFTS